MKVNQIRKFERGAITSPFANLNHKPLANNHFLTKPKSILNKMIRTIYDKANLKSG